ncbi:hypothetical protein V493_06192 [Pseudogymnoascus sp. VKM F-4281 (FW-2241)]|nr:hypothetical protein V493_06192 [Pseudogymnoascus sp. VKM F-4281 (FW-2241)]
MSRWSARESLEEAFYDCQQTSVGFLTPSLNQSHSDSPSGDDDDPTEDAIHFLCCYIPKIHLPQLQPIRCLGVSLAKGEPTAIRARSHAPRAGMSLRARYKSASVATDGAMRFVGHSEPDPTIITSFTSMVRDSNVESLGRRDSTITVCRNALFSRGRRNDTVSEMAMKRNSHGNMEPPTIVTLRRAIAVLNTLAQPRIQAFSADVNNAAMLREYRRSIRSMASPAEYLITSEEIRGLKSQMKRKFILPTSKQTIVKEKEYLTGLGWKGRVKKSSSGSVVWFGAPRKNLQSNAALSVSNVHTAYRSIVSRERKGHFMSHVAQRTSIISMLMTGKSIHEMIWEDDGKLQNLFSSTWGLATSMRQGDLATRSRNSYRRDPNTASIEYRASYGGETAITAKMRTSKTVLEHPSEKSSNTPYDIDKSLSLSEVRIPRYVTQQFSICTPKPISDGVWLPPISSFENPIIEIPTANLRPSVLDPGPVGSIWRDSLMALNPQPKHPLLRSLAADALGKPALAAPATLSEPKPSLWGQSTRMLVRVPVGSRPKPSLWRSDVAASGQMAITRSDKESTAEVTPRLWKRASARRLRDALGMGSGESWKRVAGVENIKDAETLIENADDRVPWGADTLDDVPIISEEIESDESWKRDSRSWKGKKRLLRTINQKAEHIRAKLIATREKASEMKEDIKYKERGAESNCPSEKAINQHGRLEEKSKYDELEDWVCGLREASPVLRPRSSRNYMNLYGGSRATDRKVSDNRPLRLEGGSRRSLSITTIVW